MRIKINNIPFESNEKMTVLEAAGFMGIKIPTLCYLKNLAPNTSCMVCMVKDKQNDRFVPSCSTLIYNGMDIDSESNEVMNVRKTALEFLLSEHVGDCSGPCESACRFNLNIPEVFNAIEQGQIQKAITLLRKDLGLPFLVNDFCSGYCENACRRKRVDKAVGIKHIIHEFLINNTIKDYGEKKNKEFSVLITATGIKAIALASFLDVNGFSVSLLGFENDIIQQDMDFLKRTEIIFLEKLPDINKMYEKYNALVTDTDKGINQIKTFVMENDHLSKTKKFVLQDVREAKELAQKVIQHFYNKQVYDYSYRFVSKTGYLDKDEINVYLDRQKSIPQNDRNQVYEEIQKCLKCNCDGFDKCRLRQYAAEYGANRKTYKAADRQKVNIVIDSLSQKIKTEKKQISHDHGKCIKCGICVQITRKNKENIGLSFFNRGIYTQIGVPFGKTLSQGLENSMDECLDCCPTGALKVE